MFVKGPVLSYLLLVYKERLTCHLVSKETVMTVGYVITFWRQLNQIEGREQLTMLPTLKS